MVLSSRGWQDHPVGPTAIFDKSALQALSMDESVWFEAFFLPNLVPVFYVETLADLEKEVAEGKTPEDLVGMLAGKTPSNAAPNVHHRQLLLADLMGQGLAMDGRTVISGGETKQMPDGSIGVHVDEFPETAALLRWMRSEFLEIEREVAKGWRAELAQHDPTQVVDVLGAIFSDETKISDLEQLKASVDSFCSRSDPHLLALAFEVLDVPDDYRRAGLARWEAHGRPPLDQFAPYLVHVFKVDLLYYLGIHRGFISAERASNKADMAYLYYLPFGMVFVSGDNLHRRTVPLFLREDQSYLPAAELKGALQEMDEHYDALPDEIKQLGVMRFVSYPPSSIDNAVTHAWDSHMRADWREIAKAQEANIGKPPDDDQLQSGADLKVRLEQAQSIPEGVAGSDPDPDYLTISRYVPAQRGKWRIVPEGLEEEAD